MNRLFSIKKSFLDSTNHLHCPYKCAPSVSNYTLIIEKTLSCANWQVRVILTDIVLIKQNVHMCVTMQEDQNFYNNKIALYHDYVSAAFDIYMYLTSIRCGSWFLTFEADRFLIVIMQARPNLSEHNQSLDGWLQYVTQSMASTSKLFFTVYKVEHQYRWW